MSKTARLVLGCAILLSCSTATVAAEPEFGPGVKSVPVKLYPKAAMEAREEGTVGYRVEVSSKGELDSCEITRSSGFKRLDKATCTLLVRYGRSLPGKDAAGPTSAKYDGQIVWKL